MTYTTETRHDIKHKEIRILIKIQGRLPLFSYQFTDVPKILLGKAQTRQTRFLFKLSFRRLLFMKAFQTFNAYTIQKHSGCNTLIFII